MARERGLYRRKDSRFWWIGLVLPDGRRVCKSTGCINRTDAESYAVRLKNEAIEARQQGLLGVFVWQQAVVRYLEEFADKRSLSDDKDHLKKLDPYLRSLKLEAIDVTVLQPFIHDRKVKDGVSNATVNRALEVVRRILNVAHQDWRWLRGVPKIRMLKVTPAARATGLRSNELLKAKWENVDWDRGTLFIGLTKNGDPLLAPLTDDALERLRAIPRVANNPHIICGKNMGAHLTGIREPLQRVLKHAGIENLRIHDLRRTVGSWLAQDGVSLHLIGQVLNHRDTKTTAGYAYFQTQQRREVLASHGQRIFAMSPYRQRVAHEREPTDLHRILAADIYSPSRETSTAATDDGDRAAIGRLRCRARKALPASRHSYPLARLLASRRRRAAAREDRIAAGTGRVAGIAPDSRSSAAPLRSDR